MGLNVVLFQPEIPQNTGNIMRTCAGTNTTLHLIEPLGFKVDEKSLKRSGVNYLEHAEFKVYPDWETFYSLNPGEYVFFTRYGKKAPHQFDFTDKDKAYYLVFGRESTGIPKAILAQHLDQCTRFPMNDHIRSLNLANTVCLGIYEALRQRNYEGLFQTEPESLKGPNWLIEE
jgi:tRNA (cytidine/uridine-2'-O-)-methyltransferase